MNKTTLIHSLYQISAIKFGEFTLKSGQTSKIYLDLRQIVSYPQILQSVAQAIWQVVDGCKIDVICGVPYTALPIATCISIQQNIPMIMRRKEKKSYGTKQQIEGRFQAGQHCLIIEDVITSGGSILETADELISAGLKIVDLAVLIDRQQGGKENLQKQNYVVHAVFTLQEIMQELLHSDLLSLPEREIVTTLIEERA
ncbi:MAG: orotate phosphoribosyltransferase [Gammaproteobacteria bacterium]